MALTSNLVDQVADAIVTSDEVSSRSEATSVNSKIANVWTRGPFAPNRNTEAKATSHTEALGRMRVSGPSTEEGTAVTQAPTCGWLTRFRRCLSRGDGAEAMREDRMEESKEKEASC